MAGTMVLVLMGVGPFAGAAISAAIWKVLSKE